VVVVVFCGVVLRAVQNETIGYVVVWQHVLGVACVLCAVQNE
jgi:hypothetical protein